MREYKSLAEWLESKGNPKHFIAEGESGSMVIAIEDKDALVPGITLYTYHETQLPDGGTSFWLNAGWGIRREYLPAIKGLLNTEVSDDTAVPIWFEVLIWGDDEAEYGIDFIKAYTKAYTKAHAELVLRNGIRSGKYPKGAWVERDAVTDKRALKNREVAV